MSTFVLKPKEWIPCRICSSPTLMLGTKLCDRCWELERRIHSEDFKRNEEVNTAPMTPEEVLSAIRQIFERAAVARGVDHAHGVELMQRHENVRAAVSALVEEVKRVKQILNMSGVPDERMRGHISTGVDCLISRMSKESMLLTADLAAARSHVARMTHWLEQNQPDVFRRGMWEAISGKT